MKGLRLSLIALGALAIAALFGNQIRALENIRHTGQTVLLELRPVDPRALMMGDFMALRYRAEFPADLPPDYPPAGQFVLTLGENAVGTFSRIDNGTALSAGEIKINYIRQRRRVTFGAPRYYFQNGTAEDYEAARYGIFKIAPSGRAILVALADKDFKKIVPGAQ